VRLLIISLPCLTSQHIAAISLLSCEQPREPSSMISRYPSPAELDAFAQKTANSPLSIKIFPSDVRVPQHKQLSKTVNGLDTTGQRYSPYSHPYSGGYQGLLAIVKASVVVKGVVKTSEGRRTKHVNSQGSVAPYNNPLNNGYTVRNMHKAYRVNSCKPPDAPIETLCSSVGIASGDQSLPPQSELAEVQSLMRQMSRVPHSQAPQLGGEARASPSLQAVAAVAHSDSDFVLGVPPQSSLAFAGAVLPTQSADRAKAGYLDKGDYTVWQHKAQMQQQQPYQQGAVRMYGVSSSAQGHRAAEAGVGLSPETCLPLARSSQMPYRPRDVDQNLCCGLSSSSLCHAAVLSSSLQSLECLISEIHPPCIKERMLGRGYEAMGMPPLMEHQQQAHIQLPVYR
uniref:Family with sequence similarity 222 member A n=1 Tax=Neolamprologus brichardi TaxID=32507 RepID=A0A3Q4M9S8_NEOBR